MQYQDLQNKIAQLDFIDGSAEADAAIKAVLGIMASRLDEQRARDLANCLPDPLDFDTLRGMQQDGLEVSANDYVGQVANQFKLGDGESRRLIDTVMRRTREGIGDQRFDQICQGLPQDWQDLLRRM